VIVKLEKVCALGGHARYFVLTIGLLTCVRIPVTLKSFAVDKLFAAAALKTLANDSSR